MRSVTRRMAGWLALGASAAGVLCVGLTSAPAQTQYVVENGVTYRQTVRQVYQRVDAPSTNVNCANLNTTGANSNYGAIVPVQYQAPVGTVQSSYYAPQVTQPYSTVPGVNTQYVPRTVVTRTPVGFGAPAAATVNAAVSAGVPVAPVSTPYGAPVTYDAPVATTGTGGKWFPWRLRWTADQGLAWVREPNAAVATPAVYPSPMVISSGYAPPVATYVPAPYASPATYGSNPTITAANVPLGQSYGPPVSNGPIASTFRNATYATPVLPRFANQPVRNTFRQITGQPVVLPPPATYAATNSGVPIVPVSASSTTGGGRYEWRPSKR